MSSSEPTRVETWLQRVKNHKVLSLFIICGVVLISIASVSNALLDLKKIFLGESETAIPVAESAKGADTGHRAGLAIALHNVAFDDKADVIAATEFSSKSDELDESVFSDIVEWIARELKLVTDQPNVTVTVNVQPDWQNAKPSLTREPDGQVEYFLRYVMGDASGSREREKIRVPISSQTDSLADISDIVSRCQLEVRVPGYGSRVVDIVRGEVLTATLTLSPDTTRIGVETLKGPMPEASDRIAVALARHPRIDVVSPDTLNRIREEIKAHNRSINENPGIQDSYRELTVDYIVGGSVYVSR